jgi:predicted transcriptional regulator
MCPTNPTLNPVELATELTIAWLSNQNNRVQADDVPQFLRKMHATVTELAGELRAPRKLLRRPRLPKNSRLRSRCASLWRRRITSSP